MKRKDRLGKNKYTLLLFRLLTVKHRLVYPISKGSTRRIDKDLDSFISHKVVTSLHKALR